MLIATFGTYSKQKKIEHLQNVGVPVQAEVYDSRRDVRTSYDSDGYERRTTTYYVSLRFESPSGQRYDNERRVSSSIAHRYSGARRQSPMTAQVIVDPNDISKWEFAEGMSKPGKGIYLLFAFISLFGFGMIGFGVYRLKNPPKMPPDQGDDGYEDGPYDDHGNPMPGPGQPPMQHPGGHPQQHPGGHQQHPPQGPQRHPGQ
jgi:hypothetical protein